MRSTKAALDDTRREAGELERKLAKANAERRDAMRKGQVATEKLEAAQKGSSKLASKLAACDAEIAAMQKAKVSLHLFTGRLAFDLVGMHPCVRARTHVRRQK